MDMGRRYSGMGCMVAWAAWRGHVLNGLGQEPRAGTMVYCLEMGGRGELLTRMGRRGGVLTGYRPERWNSDWKWERRMVY